MAVLDIIKSLLIGSSLLLIVLVAGYVLINIQIVSIIILIIAALAYATFIGSIILDWWRSRS